MPLGLNADMNVRRIPNGKRPIAGACWKKNRARNNYEQKPRRSVHVSPQSIRSCRASASISPAIRIVYFLSEAFASVVRVVLFQKEEIAGMLFVEEAIGKIAVLPWLGRDWTRRKT